MILAIVLPFLPFARAGEPAQSGNRDARISHGPTLRGRFSQPKLHTKEQDR
jgi:hypothetical protein